jgi:hypothetical protein
MFDREILKRFWHPVVIGCDNGCWERRAARSGVGYSQVRANGKQWLAHRFAWTHFNGPIPDGMFVCHRCDNRICVRPDHLFLGTNADNMRDKVEKGRVTKGEEIGVAKLTESAVREIRASTESQKVLAERFGIHKSNVSRVRTRTTWEHVK